VHRASLKIWMAKEALGSRELLGGLKKAHEVSVSLSTLRHELKRLGQVWQRTRTHLKKCDEQRFEQAQQDIAALMKKAQAGEIELAYVDESGFASQPPNRSAWTKRGESHAVTAPRGQRLNVIGATLVR